MSTHADKSQENKTQAVSMEASQMQQDGVSLFQFQDNRPETIAQLKVQAAANNSPQVQKTTQLQNLAQSIQKKENNTGLPDNLKSGIENLSGHSMDAVKVHYNSPKPAQLQAHAYAQGTNIHIASGQEKHLAHEAWHVVQQKQGRVQPTKQLKGKVNINDDKGLEREADVMGQKSLQTSSMKSSFGNRIVQQKTIDLVIQRKPPEQIDGRIYRDSDAKDIDLHYIGPTSGGSTLVFKALINRNNHRIWYQKDAQKYMLVDENFKTFNSLSDLQIYLQFGPQDSNIESQKLDSVDRDAYLHPKSMRKSRLIKRKKSRTSLFSKSTEKKGVPVEDIEVNALNLELGTLIEFNLDDGNHLGKVVNVSLQKGQYVVELEGEDKLVNVHESNITKIRRQAKISFPKGEKGALALLKYEQALVYNLLQQGLSINLNQASLKNVLWRNTCEWILTGQCELCVLVPTSNSINKVKTGSTEYFDKNVTYPNLGGRSRPTNKNTDVNENDTVAFFRSGENKMYVLRHPEGRNYHNLEKLKSTLIHETQHNADRHRVDFGDRWVEEMPSIGHQSNQESPKDKLGKENKNKLYNSFVTEFRAYWLEHVFDQESGSLKLKEDEHIGIKSHIKREYSYYGKYFDSDNPNLREAAETYTSPTGGNLMNSIRIEDIAKMLDGFRRKGISSKRIEALIIKIKYIIHFMNRYELLFLEDEKFSSPFWDYMNKIIPEESKEIKVLVSELSEIYKIEESSLRIEPQRRLSMPIIKSKDQDKDNSTSEDDSVEEFQRWKEKKYALDTDSRNQVEGDSFDDFLRWKKRRNKPAYPISSYMVEDDSSSEDDSYEDYLRWKKQRGKKY